MREEGEACASPLGVGGGPPQHPTHRSERADALRAIYAELASDFGTRMPHMLAAPPSPAERKVATADTENVSSKSVRLWRPAVIKTDEGYFIWRRRTTSGRVPTCNRRHHTLGARSFVFKQGKTGMDAKGTDADFWGPNGQGRGRNWVATLLGKSPTRWPSPAKAGRRGRSATLVNAAHRQAVNTTAWTPGHERRIIDSHIFIDRTATDIYLERGLNGIWPRPLAGLCETSGTDRRLSRRGRSANAAFAAAVSAGRNPSAWSALFEQPLRRSGARQWRGSRRR